MGVKQMSIARVVISTCVQVADYLNSGKPITANTNVVSEPKAKAFAAAA